MTNVMKEIYKLIDGLDYNEAISILESIKLDIILNHPLVIIDGKVGRKIEECPKNITTT